MTNDAIDRAIKRGTGERRRRHVRDDHVRGVRARRRGAADRRADRQPQPHRRRDPQRCSRSWAARWPSPARSAGSSTARGVIMRRRADRRGRADDGRARSRRRGRRRRRWHVAGHVRPDRDVTRSAMRSRPPGITVMSADTPMVPRQPGAGHDRSRTPRRCCASWRRIEDNDDVQDVYSNFDISDEVMEAVGRMSVGVGDRAPDFTLPGTGGTTLLAGRLRSASRSCSCSIRVTTRRCAPSSSTPTTTGSSEFAELDAQVIGISAQDVDSHDAFAAKHGFEFPLLADTDKDVAGRVRHARPDRVPPPQRVHHRPRRRDPLRPPRHRRPDVPTGERAARGARSARLTLVSAVGVRCPGTASDRSPRTAHRRRRCATRPPG